MTPSPLYVNISGVKRFKECRARWLIEWHLNRVPIEGALPLNLGKLVHEVFDCYLTPAVIPIQGGTIPVRHTMQGAIQQTVGKWVDAATTNLAAQRISQREYEDMIAAKEAFDDLWEPLQHWKDQFPIERTLEVEAPFEYPHPSDPSIIIRGRPDRVAVVFGRRVHIQNRTLAAGINFGLYTELAKRDYHELIYAWAMQQKYPDLSGGGTLMNLIRKLKYRAKPTKNNPEGKILHDLSEIFGQYMVPMKDEQVELALADLLWDAHEMRRTIEEFETTGRFPAPNRKLDGGPYGNRIDPYFNVFMGKVSVHDNTFFKNREDMYAGTAEDESGN